MRRLVVLAALLVLGALGVGVALAASDLASGQGSPGAALARHDSAGVRTLSIRAGGRTRSYLLYVPPGDSARHPLPLVLVYHGADDTDWDAASESGLLSYAKSSHSMIVAFLQGYEDTWNDDAGDPPAEQANVNDLAFTEAVLSRTESEHHVIPNRIVATGFSNGAILTELLGCRLASYLTLIVPVEGQLSPRFAGSCRPGKPLTVYEIHATADSSIPYSGGTFSGVGGSVRVLSAAASAARWAALNRCSAPSTARSGAAGGSVLTQYTGCAGGATVTLESIQGGSHEWPPGFAETLGRVVASMHETRRAVAP